MCIIEHDLPVYYNPENNGLHVVHSQNGDTVIVGECCRFYNDAYTCILRYEIPSEYLNNWILLDKNNLLKYPFIGKHLQNTIHVQEKYIDDDSKRCSWYTNPCIINRYHKIK